MKNIDFSMTYLALKMFGKQLYANISAAIAELVANGLDAKAENVYIYMDIRDRNSATIAIYDDGEGMDEETLESNYAVVGRNKRENLNPEEAVKIMGRKGIGKLAALYLSNQYYIITKTAFMNVPRAWMLEISKEQKDDKKPQLIEVAYPLQMEDVFGKKLIESKKGTIILLKNVKISNFGEAAEDALEHKLANYFLTTNLSQNIKLCILKKDSDEMKFKPVTKSIAHKNMAIIYTTDETKFANLNNEIIYFRDKSLNTKEQTYQTKREVLPIPKLIDTTLKDETGKSQKFSKSISGEIEIDDKKYQYVLEGWIGIHSTIEQSDAKLNCENFKKNMHYNPNQLRIYVRNKLATSSFLNYLGMTATFINYIEGEISFDVLDVEGLEDIATAGRDNFSVQDERVQLLIALCKGIVSKLVAKRQKIADDMKTHRQLMEDLAKEEERREIKSRFKKGAIKSKEVLDNLPIEHQQAFEDDFFQFTRAANISNPTKRILISHKKDCENFGNFLIDVLLKMCPELRPNIIFTSNSDFGVPAGYDICSYLNECFREDIHVIFLFSRSYYDSNICLAEAGAAWGTNRTYTNFVIDMGFGDISEPINKGQKGSFLLNMDEEARKDLSKELIRIVNIVGIEKDFTVDEVIDIISEKMIDHEEQLVAPKYRPYRKFQAVPVCKNCKHPMNIGFDQEELKYTCDCGYEFINSKII